MLGRLPITSAEVRLIVLRECESGRNGARSSKLSKQLACANCASLHLSPFSQSFAFASISKPPPPPLAHNGGIQWVHLSSVTCLQPHLPLESPFSSLALVSLLFLPPCRHLTPLATRVSHPGWGAGGVRQTHSQREGQRGACRDAGEDRLLGIKC